MTDEEQVRIVREKVAELLKGNFDGHDLAHTERVFKNACIIREKEQKGDLKFIKTAALLHDADDHKIFDTRDNSNARKILASAGFSKREEDEICEIINAVSFSKNKGKRPERIEAAIVQDADRLDAMGAIGIARTFAYGGKHGRSIEDSLQHFYDKLLHLKDGLNTDAAKMLAEKRHELLVRFVEEMKEEL